MDNKTPKPAAESLLTGDQKPVTSLVRDVVPGAAWSIGSRCPQPGTILVGYPPLPLLRELPGWLPSLQPWITRIDPNCGQRAWSPWELADTPVLEQPWGRFLAGQWREFGAVAVLRGAALERPIC